MQLDTTDQVAVSQLAVRRLVQPRRRRVSVRKQELVELTTQLAIMLRTGVDVASSLSSLARQCRRPATSRMLHDIHEQVLGGRAFSEALRSYPEVFDEAFVATTAVGEASGDMAEVLNQLAQLQRSQYQMQRTIRSMLIYPVLLTVVATIVIIILLIFVLPRFAQLFADYDTPLPWITKVFLYISTGLREKWWVWVPGGLLAGAGLLILPNTKGGRQLWDHLLLNCVVLREVTRTLMIGRACRMIGLMLNTGVPLLDSVQLAHRMAKNSLYRTLFGEIEQAVMNGRTFASVLIHSDIVPPSAAEMLATAEQTGKLAEVTCLVGEHFEEEGEARARQVVTLLEPLITVVMGTFIATVVLAVMLPVFDLSTFAGAH